MIPRVETPLSVQIGTICAAEGIKKDGTFAAGLAYRTGTDVVRREQISRWRAESERPPADKLRGIEEWYFESLKRLVQDSPLVDLDRKRRQIAAYAELIPDDKVAEVHANLHEMIHGAKPASLGPTTKSQLPKEDAPSNNTGGVPRSRGGTGDKSSSKKKAG